MLKKMCKYYKTGMFLKQLRSLGKVREKFVFFTSDQKHFDVLSVRETSNLENVPLKVLKMVLQNECNMCSHYDAACKREVQGPGDS